MTTSTSRHTPLPHVTDWLDNVLTVGDSVIVTQRVGDRPGMYSGEIVDLGEFFEYGTGVIKVKVQPTGRYSLYPHHVWPEDRNMFGDTVRVGFPRANWILLQNVTRSPVQVYGFGKETRPN